MPGPYLSPGVYVEEIPSGVRPITAVSTSNTAFVDFFARGPENEARRIGGMADFEREFGGLDARSEGSYAVQQFFLNGGSVAWVVRVTADAVPAERALLGGPAYGSGVIGLGASGASGASGGPGMSGGPGASGGSGAAGASGAVGGGGVSLVVRAANGGRWGNNLQVAIDHRTADPTTQFNLVVREIEIVRNEVRGLRGETFRNLSLDKTSPRYALDVVNDAPSLIRLALPTAGGTLGMPAGTGVDVIGSPDTAHFLSLGSARVSVGFDGVDPRDRIPPGTVPPFAGGAFMMGDDGIVPSETNTAWSASRGAAALLGGDTGALDRKGIYALEGSFPEGFNLLCLPGAADLEEDDALAVIKAAEKYCVDKRAFLILDVPARVDEQADDRAKLRFMHDWLGKLEGQGLRNENAAIYFPRVTIKDPRNEYRDRHVAASGTLAGVYARTDATRGVWKAPAGTEANLRGAAVAAKLGDKENETLNPVGVNALRTFPIFGSVSWGARTLQGADVQASQWKYVPVRRTALFIEESLYRGLKWVVFEPNDEPLWSQIRLNVGAFMHNLFRQGAFQGRSPREAYLVRCDTETTTQTDIELGIVNVIVGFAPLKPAEFVVIKLQQIAGQVQV